jgi:hypothetical protein
VPRSNRPSSNKRLLLIATHLTPTTKGTVITMPRWGKRTQADLQTQDTVVAQMVTNLLHTASQYYVTHSTRLCIRWAGA